MAEEKKHGFHLVLVGIGLGALYWFVESLLYLFLSEDLNFFRHLFSPDLAAIYRRGIVICLLVLFGSHCQSRLKACEQETEEWMAYAQHLESGGAPAEAEPETAE